MVAVATTTAVQGGQDTAAAAVRSGFKGQSSEEWEMNWWSQQVADCVCLMGLGHLQAVPVDVHVWRLAQRDYGVIGASSLTAAVYKSVGQLCGVVWWQESTLCLQGRGSGRCLERLLAGLRQ